jgi:serine phosphatase RsbU (regulator of sigma subunit)/Tfp pilus assembly protein PilF
MVRLVFSTLLLLFCIMQYEAIAQDADSLENQVKGLKGKEKMEVLLKISNNTRNYAPQMSIDFGERYLTMAEELRDSAAMVEGLQNLGITYYNIGDFEKTIHCFLQALRIEEGRNHIKGVAQAYNNLGVVFEEIGQEEKALNYYQRSLTIKEELKDSVFMANTISNIGYIYLHMGEVREALQYFNQSLTLDKLLNNEEGIIKSLNNIGESYTALNKYDSALYFFNQALAKNEILSTYEKAQLYNNIANVYLNSQNYRKAIEIYQTALNLGKTVQAVVNIQDSYKGLSDAYSGLRDFERGLQYYKLYTASKDSVLNEDSAIKIARIETDYRIQKREKEIELLKKEAEIRNLNLAKNRAVSYFLMGSLLLFLALVGILYHKYHFKQKANEMLEHQNREIANKNLNILDSILYAKGIQEAILPDTTVLDKVFKEAFIYCTPRDIVNGDFFWFAGRGNFLVMAAVDCTGHGVPGAFMTVMGNSMLNQIVLEHDIYRPSEILYELNKSVLNTLHQENFNMNKNDGMDIAICLYDTTTGELVFAGAKRPIYYFKDNMFNSIKGSKYSVGGTFNRQKKCFEDHTIQLNTDDTFYLFSDGITDQFGEKLNKKFMNRRWKELLVSIQSLSMEAQSKAIAETMEKWRGNFEQTDDMLVIGVRV